MVAFASQSMTKNRGANRRAASREQACPRAASQGNLQMINLGRTVITLEDRSAILKDPDRTAASEIVPSIGGCTQEQPYGLYLNCSMCPSAEAEHKSYKVVSGGGGEIKPCFIHCFMAFRSKQVIGFHFCAGLSEMIRLHVSRQTNKKISFIKHMR